MAGLPAPEQSVTHPSSNKHPIPYHGFILLHQKI